MRRTSGRAGGWRLLGALALPGLLLLAAAGGGSGCQPIRAGASAGVWLSSFSAEVQGNGPGGVPPGSVIDFGANLDTGGGMQVVPGGEVWVQLWKFRVKGNVWQLATDATTTLAGTLTFEGSTFDAGADVASDLELLHARAALEFEILNNFGPWKFNLGVGLGASLIDLDFSLRELPPLTDAESISEFLPYPVAGVSFDFTPVACLTLGAELYGLSTLGLINDVDGHVFDAAVSVRYNIPKLGGRLSVGAQYRYWTIEAEATRSGFDGSASVTNHGAMLFVMGQF